MDFALLEHQRSQSYEELSLEADASEVFTKWRVVFLYTEL